MFPALRTHPLGWVSVVQVVMFRLPDKFASASVPWQPVSRPLAASLALSTQRASLQAAVVGGFSYPNFFHAIGLAPSGGSILSSIAKKESGKKDATKGGGRSPHLWNPPPAYSIGTAAAHCTGYQAGL